MIRFAENLNKMITAGLGGALEAPRTEVAVGHRAIYTEASGAVVNFESNVVAPVKNLRVTMEPIQAGSGDPSPENIRPITGRDSVTVERTGVNLFPNPSGAWSTVDLKAGVEYCFSAKGASSAVAVAGKYADGTAWTTLFLNKSSGDTRYNSRVLEKDVTEIKIYLNGVTLYDCQIEVGSTPSAYAPYDGQSITIQLGQTVYGGTVDVTTGMMTVDRIGVSFDGSETWNKSNTYQGGYYMGSANFLAKFRAKFKANTPFACSHAKTVSAISQYVFGTCYCDSTMSIRIMPEDSTLADWKAYLLAQANANTPVQVCCYVETPFTIQLTPAQLSTLAGENNIWSDAGNIFLEFPCYEETEGY